LDLGGMFAHAFSSAAFSGCHQYRKLCQRAACRLL
jgi:hypothetical protein